MSQQELVNEFLAFVESQPDRQLRDAVAKQHFGARWGQFGPVINSLLSSHRVMLLQGDGKLAYGLEDPDMVDKLSGINKESLMVYEAIRRSHDQGIWTQDIRKQTGVQQTQMTKCIKDLTSRQLIKTVTSVHARRRKLYMLIDVVPAAEVTGGPWYTENEFDHEFLRHLSNRVVHFVSEKKRATLQEIAQDLSGSGITTVVLREEEVAQLVNSLIFDSRLEEVKYRQQQQPGVGQAKTATQYKLMATVRTPQAWTNMPCGRCHVRDNCTPGGVVSPEGCHYMSEWLARADGTPADELF